MTTYLTTGDHLIKSISVNSNNTYDNNRHITLGLREPSSLGSLVNSAFQGAAPTIRLVRAEAIARDLSHEIESPVRVVTTLKIPSFEKSTYFETNAETGEETLRAGISPETVWVPTALKVDDITKFRATIRFLDDREYISTEERAALNPIITQEERQTAFADQLTSAISTAQTDLIGQFADPFVMGIIDACADIENSQALAGKCGNWGAVLPTDFSRRDLAFAVLADSMRGAAATVFYEAYEGLRENCHDLGSTLAKIYRGNSDLESALRQSGTGVPTIEKQREELFDYIDTQLSAKFPNDAGSLGAKDSAVYQSCKERFVNNRMPLLCRSNELNILNKLSQ